MPWIPEEEIKRAREITAIEYLKKYQPNRLKKSSARNEWELTDHDSFKINEQTSQWHWKSRDIGGTSALNFLIHVDGCSFLEAVQMLKDEYPTYIPPPVEAKPKKPFVLPTASPDCRRVFRYLKERGISGEVLQRCVHLGILYESLPYHNAVFIGGMKTRWQDMLSCVGFTMPAESLLRWNRPEVKRHTLFVFRRNRDADGLLFMKPVWMCLPT